MDMDPNRETQQMKSGRVGGLLKKINHAVKSSEHFRSSLTSLINSDMSPPPHVQERSPVLSSSERHGGVGGGDGATLQGDPSSKTLQSSRTAFTITPDHDGYMWRKYGEKKIAKSRFPRCYYRCTYHSELNCNATKQVEQCTDDDPPMYKVTYFNEHICNDISFYNTAATNNWQQMLDFSVKETSVISVQRQQYIASSSEGPSVVCSSINNPQISDQGLIEFDSMEMDLSWYQPYDIYG